MTMKKRTGTDFPSIPAVVFCVCAWVSSFCVVQAAPSIRPAGYVNDAAGVLDQPPAQQLESVLTDLEQRTGAEVAVVTVPTVKVGDIERAAVDLYHDWGIGKRGKDNGVLILCVIQDRRVRIEVGYGLEHVLTDATCGRIIREQMAPHFRAGHYAAGLLQGTLAVTALIAQDAGVSVAGVSALAERAPTYGAGFDWRLILYVVIMLLVFTVRIGLFGMSGVLFGGGAYGGGWSGGGGFSGGFGGFGGGSSGGGGASGSW